MRRTRTSGFEVTTHKRACIWKLMRDSWTVCAHASALPSDSSSSPGKFDAALRTVHSVVRASSSLSSATAVFAPNANRLRPWGGQDLEV